MPLTSKMTSLELPCPICEARAGFMAAHPECALYRCTSCGHAFSDTQVVAGVEQYDDHYYDKDHQRWFENPNIGLFARIAAMIPNEREFSRVLDVGCGRGDFLRYLARARPGLALTGIDVAKLEPSESIRFLRGDILSASLGESFDIVVSLAVIEHVADVRKFARRLRELCRPGGLIVVMTVNEASLMYWLARTLRHVGFSRAFDRLYGQHHVNHFTQNSLRALWTSRNLQPLRHFTHNGLLAATDIPASSMLSAFVLRCGVAGIMVAGKILNRMYLQTAVYRNPVP